MKQTPETVILIDCGYDGIQKLARAVRDKKIYTMVIPCTAPVDRVMAENPVGIVFVSGGNCGRLSEAQNKFASAFGEIKKEENGVCVKERRKY
jgi:carbamoylphosphate synthase small subunit